MPLHDISYKHWEGAHIGLWGRRWVIASAGVKSCLQNKWMRNLIVLCWISGMGMTALLFVVGQLLVTDSFISTRLWNLSREIQSFAVLLTSWLENHPEISVRTTQNLMFNFYCVWILMPLSIFALGMAMPLFITRDLASNAIIIYSSKAISRSDYFLGKFATAFGLLCWTWLGPVCAAWFLGNLLAPDWKFFWHASGALWHILLASVCVMSVLSLLALGVSSLSIKEKATPALWFSWWILGGVIGPIAMHTQPWLRHISFNFNLNQLVFSIFQPGVELQLMKDNIPVFGYLLDQTVRSTTLKALTNPTTMGAAVSLFIMIALAVVLLRKKVKTQ
jgi:ABC-2 type transport system permease protein